jgi:hypothetical protein
VEEASFYTKRAEEGRARNVAGITSDFTFSGLIFRYLSTDAAAKGVRAIHLGRR